MHRNAGTGRRGRLAALALALGFATAGCGSGDTSSDRAPLTDAQRDSVISESPLPGAHTVDKARELADSAAARRTRGVPDGN